MSGKGGVGLGKASLKRKYEDYELPPRVKEFIVTNMEAFKCCTHDVAHCFRVANLARTLAECEDGADVKIAYIAGTMHDILDSKLLASENVGNAESALVALLREHPDFVTEDEIQHILKIIKAVGYKNVIKEGWKPYDMSVEYRCVQDADLLDAIGAIGVARTFAYSGKKNRPLFGVTKPVSGSNISHQDYMATRDSVTDSCVDHFFDKLLRIHKYISTAQGKRLAAERQQKMISFLQDIDVEMVNCSDTTARQIKDALPSLNKVSNSKTAHALFVEDKRYELCQHNLTISEIGREIGLAWANISAEEKAKYEEKASQLQLN